MTSKEGILPTLLTLGAILLVPVASASAAPQSQTFGWNNTASQQFTVPANIHQLHLTAWGGSGGAGGSRSGIYQAPGGLGAKIDLDVAVVPGETLRLDVGGRGGFGFSQTPGDGATAGASARRGGTAGTVNNHDLDGTAGGGGGGATTVMNGVGTTLLVAGGGGGGGGGGASVAGNNGGQGGDAGTAVSRGCDPSNGPGTYGNGAGGGAGGSCAVGNGPAGVGGSGEAPATGAGTGGGGGGGLSGGSGGSAGGVGGGGGGGGGAGTSFWSEGATNAVVTNGGPGFGGVVVSWDATPPAGVPHTRTLGTGQNFVVPPGVSELTILATGGAGGAGSGGQFRVPARGGYGAAIRERVSVQPGDSLAVQAGGIGGGGLFSSDGQATPIHGGSGGSGGGGAGGDVTASNGSPNDFIGGTGGGGGGTTQVVNTSTGTTLVTAGGGGGGGGGSAIANAGINGGPGGNAGSPLVSGSDADGNGFYGSGGSTPGTANGSGGGYATSGRASGDSAANSTEGNARGTGGGGGGGVRGGGAGQQCSGASCALSAGGGGAGSSAWPGSARDVTLGNSLARGGEVRIDWIGKVVTSTAVDTSAPAVVAGAPLTVTATVTGEDAPVGSEPTGTVLFIDDDTARSLGPPVALVDGKASLTTTLTAGSHHIYAAYAGDDLFIVSTSPRRAQTVVPKLSVETAGLPSAVVGKPYSATLTASGGTGPYTWSVPGADTPAGIGFDTATGELSGTPTTAGTTEFTVRVTDVGNPRQSVDVPVTLTVDPAPNLNPVPTATPAPVTPPAHTAPPVVSSSPVTAAPSRLTLVRKPRIIRGHRVRFTVRCSGGTCSGNATVTAKHRTVGKGRFTLAAGTTRTVTLRLKTKGRSVVAVTIGQQRRTVSRTKLTIRH